ncbi:MAG: YlxR family protein [Liquorilactobacillus satsumensis]
MARKRKVPMRKDIVSGEMKPKKELVRIVKNKENDVSIDPTGKKAGRGAYLSLEVAAAKQAQSERVFDQAFRIKIPADYYEELVEYGDHQAARKELFGDGAK